MPEELVIRHCAPTLAGLKTGSIFTYRFACVRQFRQSVRMLNKKLLSKGVRVLPLRIGENSALVYVYRPAQLKADFSEQEVSEILTDLGYASAKPERCVVQLVERIRSSQEFPHEIGLFLGYPPEDVKGFVENKACGCKCVGCWKVYGDVEKAQKTFDLYKKCTNIYCAHHANGKSIERLTVAS